jgi:formylglycine-generating enzyme required for sulfatase activity
MRFARSIVSFVLLVGMSATAHGGDTSRATPDVGKLVPIPGQVFQIGTHEVTREQWAAYVEATGHDNGEWNSTFMPQGERLPVQNVSFEDIEGYLAWLNGTVKPATPFRLPTSKEWEVAARGGAKTTFPWGDDIGKGNANCDDSLCEDEQPEVAPVGSFAPNGYGLYDVIGNAWEWTSTCDPEDCTGRVVRGGSWDDDDPEYLGLAYQSWNKVGYRSNEGTGGGGFRLAQDRQ